MLTYHSREEGSKPSDSAPVVPNSTPTLTTSPSKHAVNKPSGLRSAFAPSPLALPQNNRRPGSNLRAPSSPLSASPLSPLRHASSSSAINGSDNFHQLRHTASSLTMNSEVLPSPIVINRPSALSRPPAATSDSSQPTSPTASKPHRPSVSGAESRPSLDSKLSHPARQESLDESSKSLGRNASLRSKLSISALRKKNDGGRAPSRTDSNMDDGASMISSTTADTETVQVKGGDFELVKPTLPIPSRNSEDSLATSTYSAPNPDFFRTDSPALSFSSGGAGSGPYSPVLAEPDRSASPPLTAKPTAPVDSSSVEAHRQRELKWMSIFSSVPASQARKTKKVRRLLFEGVPASVRYMVWSHLTDSKAKRMQNVYARLCDRGPVSATPEILRDVVKCFPQHQQLHPANGPLLSLLQAYLTMVPDVDYQIGMFICLGVAR